MNYPQKNDRNWTSSSISYQLLVHALVAVTEDIRFVIEESEVTVLILFDFSKAFDSISHWQLLQKLHLIPV